MGSATMIADDLNRTTAMVRDANGLATRITHPNTRVDEFVYDTRGNLLIRTEAVGTALERTTTFEYEPLFNQVTKVVDPEQNETLLAYDANGNLVTITDAQLTVKARLYDDPNCPGLVTAVTWAQGVAEEATNNFTYDPATCN